MKTFEQFKAATMAEGFDEVLTREWEANHETPVHEHPVWWLTHESNTQAMHLYDRIADKSGFIQYRKLM